MKYTTRPIGVWPGVLRTDAQRKRSVHRPVGRHSRRPRPRTRCAALQQRRPHARRHRTRLPIEDAIAFLDEHAPGFEWDYDDPEGVKVAYRYAAKRLHPDVGGTPEEFQRLDQAYRMLIEAM